MSSDNQYTALGPAIVGFQTDGTNIDRGADIAGNQFGVRGACMATGPGVIGQAGQGDADGVQGFGSGLFSGVAGFAGGVPGGAGTGVFGVGGVATDQNVFVIVRGPGVRGIGGDGPNTGPGNSVGVWGQGGPNEGSLGSPGVVGRGYDQPGINADGVQGFGMGGFSGVAGFGGTSAGTGVFGLGGGPHGQGVRGIGAGGDNTSPFNGPVGVYGQAGGSGADGVQGTGGGSSGAGVRGVSIDSEGNGVIGEANNGAGAFGIWGRSTTGFAGFFQGAVHVEGALTVTGAKSALVAFPDGSHRRLYAVESPESWFEDFGEGQLLDGKAEVRLDGHFAAVVNTDSYHVFLTEYGEHNALYVTRRTSTGFEVRAKMAGASSSFGYRIVARRKDIAGRRFEKVNLPAAKTRSARASGHPQPGVASVPVRAETL